MMVMMMMMMMTMIIIIIIINRQALQRGCKIHLFFNFVLFNDVVYLVINAGVFFSNRSWRQSRSIQCNVLKLNE